MCCLCLDIGACRSGRGSRSSWFMFVSDVITDLAEMVMGTHSYIRGSCSAALTSMVVGPACQCAETTITAFGLTFCVISRPMSCSDLKAG